MSRLNESHRDFGDGPLRESGSGRLSWPIRVLSRSRKSDAGRTLPSGLLSFSFSFSGSCVRGTTLFQHRPSLGIHVSGFVEKFEERREYLEGSRGMETKPSTEPTNGQTVCCS